MDDVTTHGAYEDAYNELLGAAGRLDTLRRLQGDGVEPHATAALHAVRFAAALLCPTVPGAARPGFSTDTERLLKLAAHWREAALALGAFAPPPPALRLVTDENAST